MATDGLEGYALESNCWYHLYSAPLFVIPFVVQIEQMIRHCMSQVLLYNTRIMYLLSLSNVHLTTPSQSGFRSLHFLTLMTLSETRFCGFTTLTFSKASFYFFSFFFTFFFDNHQNQKQSSSQVVNVLFLLSSFFFSLFLNFHSKQIISNPFHLLLIRTALKFFLLPLVIIFNFNRSLIVLKLKPNYHSHVNN